MKKTTETKELFTPTPEEMELIRAYRRERLRQYRAKNKEKQKASALAYDLRKAQEAIAAGALDVPGQDPATE